MISDKKFNLEKQEILSGSRILKNYKTKNRINFFLENAGENYLVKNKILDANTFKKNFKNIGKHGMVSLTK